MIRISALNDSSLSDTVRESPSEISTKEAQEEAAFSLYNQALQLQNEGDLEEAEAVFRELLQVGILQDVQPNQEEKKPGLTACPGLILKYSTYKNIADIANKRRDYEAAMEAYLEAISLDSSDVTLWSRIGMTALKIHNYPLGSLAFQEALKCNPNHWPSLDNIITILYTLNDYQTCLYYISRALQRDMHYVKGLAFRDQIFREHPGLRNDTVDYFLDCNSEIFNMYYNKEEGDKYVDEALEMRQIKRKLSCPPSPPVLNFTKPLTVKTWQVLGECLIDLYDTVSKADRPISFSCKVNLVKYVIADDTSNGTQKSNVSATNASKPSNDIHCDIIPEAVLNTALDILDEVAIKCETNSVTMVNDAGAAMEVDDGQSLSQGETNVPLESGSRDNRKNRKRKKFPFDIIDAAGKRRSARVRNTVTKKQQQPEYVDFAQLLQKFLPSSLLSNLNEDGNDSCANGKGLDGDTSVSEDGLGDSAQAQDSKTVVKLEETEESDVIQFLSSCFVNTGVLDVMYRYLIMLSDKQATLWSDGLCDIYCEVYSRVREHITHPSLFCQDRENDEIRDEGILTLCYCEFKMDKWMHSKFQNPPNLCMAAPQNLRVPSPIQLGPDFPGRHFNVDVDFLMHLTIRNDIIGEMFVEFTVRVMWLKARYLMLHGQMDFAIDFFGRIVELLKAEETISKDKLSFALMNCKLDNEITLDQLEKQVESLQQCQSLEELHRLHHAGEYQQVVDLLTPTFNQKRAPNKVSDNSSIPERHSQLLLLQDALWNLEDQQQCLYWGEASFHECLQQYIATSSSGSNNDWATTVSQLLAKLERCLSKDPSIIHTLLATKLKRFINNIIRVIVLQMEAPESVIEMPIGTTVPWILLYYAIQQEEEKIRSLMMKSTTKEDAVASESEQQDSVPSNDGDFGPGMPSSLMLLYSAHEYLGRRGWCNYSDGNLLLLYADVLIKELKKSTPSNPHPYKEDLEMSVEQCFFCLYGHPNKKTKAKHLQEHGCPPVLLTRERAVPLFEYFKPKQLPEFDSLKAITVSAEFEYLLRRMFSLVPPEEDPANRVDFVCAYIEGSTEEMPVFDCDLSDKPIISELYYLLADYYFKNNEQGKAIKFYLLDVSVCPNRFDSWAGMALARSSQLEQKLNSCELKNEGPIYRKATAALRCFSRALELDKTTISLWIEYGSLAYVLHSYTCRQLKQKDELELGTEVVHMLTIKRDEMLKTARHCFKAANLCEESPEEEWLHHYMLGKIAEKTGRPPKEYLHHYKLAAMHLHLDGAWYPRKIQYHNPPHFALEALEVYYRTHASIMKYLIQQEGQPLDDGTKEMLEAYLKDAAEGAFAKFQEKRQGSQTASDIEDNAILLEECKKLRQVNPLANDHDYFRRKRKNSSTEEPNKIELRHRPSTDSSSESQDSAAVKDVLNSIVSVVTERVDEITDRTERIGAIVMGDVKIVRPNAKLDITADEEEQLSSENAEKEADIEENEISNKPSNSDSSAEDIEALSCESDTSDESSQFSGKESERGIHDHRFLIKRCEEALKQCLQRFPQHYKSLFRLAHYYFTSKYHKNIQWSIDYLLGTRMPWQQCSHMSSQALFAERKNTNFFNGIWRIPIDEIDRPGSFASHMFRSVILLMNILEQSGDHNLMVHLAIQLHRNPDTGKKYLRDVDRMNLAKMAYDRSIRMLFQKMTKLCKEPTETNQSKVIQHLMDIYRAWQNMQKVVADHTSLNNLLENSYVIFRQGKIETSTPLLDQVLRFCQHQQAVTRVPSATTFPHGETQPFPVTSMPPSTSKTTFDAKNDDFFAAEFGPLVSKVNFLGGGGTLNPSSDYTQRSTGHIPARQGDSRPMRSILSPFHALSSPNFLTAAVQSKIKSLDPIEPHIHSSPIMSGFQLEFLRQISAQSLPSKPKEIKGTSLICTKRPDPPSKEVEKRPEGTSIYSHDANDGKPSQNSVKSGFLQSKTDKDQIEIV